MTVREVASVHFPALAPTLFADCTVVAFTPATDDLAAAAAATWAAVRAVARTGRSVGLVDLNLDAPTLQREARACSDEGIVDAFVFGVSLAHVARAQDEPTLHFIPVGTAPASAEEVWASPRWLRLARGFRQEGALLALFLPPAALPKLSLAPDGLVVLGAAGFSPASGVFPGIAQCLDRGSGLLAVVQVEPPAQRSAPPRRPSAARWRAPRREPRRARLAVGAVGAAGAALVVLGVALAMRWVAQRGQRDLSSTAAGVEPAAVAAPPLDRAARSQPSPPAVGAAAPAAVPGDSLFYSVQVAAFNRADQAVAFAQSLDEGAAPATVSPVRLGHQGLWFRVLVGALPTAGAADSLLRGLWQQGRLDRSSGTILRTPHAYLLGQAASAPGALELARGLRQRGVAAYIVPARGESWRVLTGAFEAPEQARVADSLLRLAGLQATLVQRTGTRP